MKAQPFLDGLAEDVGQRGGQCVIWQRNTSGMCLRLTRFGALELVVQISVDIIKHVKYLNETKVGVVAGFQEGIKEVGVVLYVVSCFTEMYLSSVVLIHVKFSKTVDN